MIFSTSLLNLVLAVITSFLILGLGIVVFLKNKKSWLNRSFGIFSLGATIWIFSAYLSDLPQLSNFSLFLNRLIFAGLSLMLLGFCHFCFLFSEEKHISKLFEVFLYLTGTFLVFLSLFSPLIIKEVVFKTWGTDFIIGPLFYFFIVFSLISISGAGKIFLKYRKATGSKKDQIRYLILGMFLFVSINIFVHLILPIIIRSREFYQIGNYSTLFFVGFTAYAIISKKLFNIKIALTELLVGLIAIILLVQTLISQTLFLRIINFSVFLLYCFFGYLLIRSILKEIELREQLEAANKELKRLDEAKTEFLSIASHQLRTPLTAIKGYLGMIEEGIYGEVPEKVKEILHKVNDSNERLIRLVNSLLDISRLELGRMQFDIEKVDIEEMLENIIDEFHVAARKKGLKLVFEHPKEKLPEVKIDPLKMRQVFLNLVDNAIKYTYQGEVIVKAELKDHGRERIRISVSDTGMGIARKEINEIFKIYRRGTGVRLFPEGSGVGLYVAKKLIEAHKGRIWAESKGKGRGSTFYVEIPVKK